MTKPKISIEPLPPERGRKVVVVDGVQWGRISMESHGGNGASYWFEQIGNHGAICESRRKVTVYGDKLANRSRGADHPVEPLAERLLATADDLVTRGLLRHPDVVKGEQDERAARLRAREEAEARERRDRDLATARKLIDAWSPCLPDPEAITEGYEALADAIADALDRARSQPR